MKLEGDVSIKKVKQVYSVLKDELKSSKDVVIDMSGVVSIDAAIAQVPMPAQPPMPIESETPQQVRAAVPPLPSETVYVIVSVAVSPASRPL